MFQTQKEWPKGLKKRTQNGIFYFESYINKKRFRRSLGTENLSEAINLLDKIKTELGDGDLTIQDIYNTYKEVQHPQTSKDTQRKDNNYFNTLLKWIDKDIEKNIRTLTPLDCLNWRTWRLNSYLSVSGSNHNKTPSPRTVNNELTQYRLFWKTAQKFYKSLDNPWMDTPKITGKHGKGEKEKQYLDSEEAKRFLEAAKSHSDLYYGVCLMLLHSGVRRGEFIHLEWKDINFKKKVINIKAKKSLLFHDRQITWESKKNKSRNIPLSPTLNEYLSNKDRTSNLVFPEKKWTKLEQIIQKVAQLIERPDITQVHAMRRSFGTICRRKGMPLETLQMILGHEDIKQTARDYAFYDDSEGLKYISLISDATI